MAKAKVSIRCVRCVAVRNYQNLAHSGTASTAQNGEGTLGGESKNLQALCSLCRCEKIRSWLTAAQRPQRRMDRGREAGGQNSPGAVFVVSL